MELGHYRKWMAFGSGVGIEIAGPDLNVTVVSVRPGGVKVLGESTIANFREQPPAEWGAQYAGFLRKLHAGHRAATILIPREELVVRQLTLPGVADRDLAAAIRFELENLHPFGDADTTFDWKRVGKTSAVVVAIARRETVDRYSVLFGEAGVKVAAFTFSGAAIYSALRVYDAPVVGFLATVTGAAGAEAYGESESRPMLSLQMDELSPRAVRFAASELRLSPEVEVSPLASVLPPVKAAPEGVDFGRTALPYATALLGAVPFPALPLNLLPKEQRQATSRLRYVPSAVLGSIVLMLGLAVAAFPGWSDRQYLGLVQGEIRKLQPRAAEATALDREIATVRNRTQVLDDYRRHTKLDMEALRALTNTLRPPTWLNSMQLSAEQVSIAGEAEQAAPLLKLLDGTKYFQNSEFTLPLSRSATGEMFSIRALRRANAQ